MNETTNSVLPHHQAAAGMWGAGGHRLRRDQLCDLGCARARGRAAEPKAGRGGARRRDRHRLVGAQRRPHRRSGGRGRHRRRPSEGGRAAVGARSAPDRVPARRRRAAAVRGRQLRSRDLDVRGHVRGQSGAGGGRSSSPGLPAGRAASATRRWVPGGAAERFFAVLGRLQRRRRRRHRRWRGADYRSTCTAPCVGRDFERRAEFDARRQTTAYYDDEARRSWDKFGGTRVFEARWRGLLNRLDVPTRRRWRCEARDVRRLPRPAFGPRYGAARRTTSTWSPSAGGAELLEVASTTGQA